MKKHPLHDAIVRYIKRKLSPSEVRALRDDLRPRLWVVSGLHPVKHTEDSVICCRNAADFTAFQQYLLGLGVPFRAQHHSDNGRPYVFVVSLPDVKSREGLENFVEAFEKTITE